jgi:hypothetical protein
MDNYKYRLIYTSEPLIHRKTFARVRYIPTARSFPAVAKFIVPDYENKVDSGKYSPFRDYEFGYSFLTEAL